MGSWETLEEFRLRMSISKAERNRRRIEKGRQTQLARPKLPIKHGTAAGWYQERRRGIRPCVSCCVARNAQIREARMRRGGA